jgi:hypothetical protein
MAGSAETGINFGRLAWADMVISHSSTLGDGMVNEWLISTADAEMELQRRSSPRCHPFPLYLLR